MKPPRLSLLAASLAFTAAALEQPQESPNLQQLMDFDLDEPPARESEPSFGPPPGGVSNRAQRRREKKR